LHTVRSIRRTLVAVKDPSVRMPPGVAKAAQLARALGAELVCFQAISAPLCLEGDFCLLNHGLAALEREARTACLERP
jgi:hypothetical protein